jgi:glycosyltransferase involved in cell wall biosynthesis
MLSDEAAIHACGSPHKFRSGSERAPWVYAMKHKHGQRPLVVIDADVLGRQRTGDESYVANLLREAGALADDLELAAVTRRPDLVPPGVRPVRLTTSSNALRMGVRLPAVLRRLRPRVSHFQYVFPVRAPGRLVVTVHDLSFEHHPEWMAFHDRLPFRTFVPRAVRRADAVITVSEWTREDILETYGIPSERVVVTPNGVDPVFRPDGLRRGGPPYLLFVGALQPRKDPLTAVSALPLLDPELHLLVAGADKRDGTVVRDRVERLGLRARVEFLGHVDMPSLASLYRGAACLVVPSRYEGFGLPVIEAMACGTPVVAARAAALPEVAGSAAVLVDPGDPEALAAGVEHALRQRESFVAAGFERAASFSWRDTARRTLAVYRELV